jgi:peptidoglycan/xylan/chitin deacetylase (PgdA/CDA1 family)
MSMNTSPWNPASPLRRRLRWIAAGLLAVSLAARGRGRVLSIEQARVVPVPILMYHKIGDAVNTAWWVTAEDFEAHLALLRAEGYQSIMPSDLAAHQAWGRRLPPKPVIITFDDGYLNAVETAEPLLRRYGFRGVCYLITGQVSETPATRQRYEGAPMLSWPEVRAAHRRGTLRFGGHTRSHANLRAMADPAGELAACYDDLRRKGGFKPEGFCYPYGQYRPDTPAHVSHAGFTTAMTCNDGIARASRQTTLLELPRISIMGGQHRYRVERVDDDKSVTLRVRKQGHSMEVHPRLVWPENPATVETGWLAPVKIKAAPVTLTWPLPPGVTTGTPVLELWDAFRVLRLYSGTIPAPPSTMPGSH